MISPLEVVRVLNRHKVSFVLVGAYGLSGWLQEARATEDVNVLVAARHVKKAIAALLREFPHLEAVEVPGGVHLGDKETGELAVDILKPLQQPYREIFKHTKKITSEGEAYRIPSLEMALAMKFAAMTSLYRADEDKFQDAHDFVEIVKANPTLEEKSLEAIASRIDPLAGRDILDYVSRVRSGKRLVL